MKKVFFILTAILPLVVTAQIDRSHAPKPLPAPEIQIVKPVSFTLNNGLKVFVVQNTKLPRVAATLSFDMDGIVEGDKAGMTSMGGQLLRRGTDKMNKAQLDEAVDFLGGSLATSSTSASASALKENFPKMMSLMSDVVLRPSLPATELEKIRKQTLSGLQAAKDDPNSIATNVVNRLLYGKDHPYGDIETEETINNVKLEDIKNYFNTYWKPNNAYLVFVGDITPDNAKKLATQYFGTWKKGVVPKMTYPTPHAPAKTYVALVDRPASVQSIINLAMPVELKPGSPDAIAASVMNSILGGGFSGRLFANLREKHGITYGAYSQLSPDRLIGSFSANASVRNEKTDSAIAEFFNEFKTIRTQAITAAEVDRMKNFLSGSFARSLENPATIANFALNIARYHLPADYYQNYLKNLAAITPEQVQAMANKYVDPQHMHIVVVGNAKEVAPGLGKYGEVEYFNVYGAPVEAPKTSAVDPGVTAQSILQKAVEAYGGQAAISAIKDVEMKGTASVMGQQVGVSQKNILPSIFLQEMSMQGMVLQKKLLKDGKYSQTAQGAEQDATAEDKEGMDEEAAFFLEPYLLGRKDYKFAVKGIEQVEGKDAYMLEVKTPAGRTYTNYYDVQSGLRVKQTLVQEVGPMGATDVSILYKGYRLFNGVQIPTELVSDLGSMTVDIKFDEIKVNSGLKAADIQ